MTIRYEIFWTDTAGSDLEEIITYISNDSVKNAHAILKKIRTKVSELSTLPERGRVIPELKDYNIISYREIVIKPWRIFYKIEGRAVFILSVIDSRRNIEDILLNKFLR